MTMLDQPRANFQFLLLDRANAPYVTGKSTTISSEQDWSLVISGVMFGTIIGFIFVLSAFGLITALIGGNTTNLGNRVLITGLLGAGTGFIIYTLLPSWRDIFKNRRLASQGQILQGEVTGVETRYVPRARMTIWRVSYRFQSPDGRTLTGVTGLPGHANAPAPASGTPLAILYADANLHKAL
jgi:hypothetical protein